MTCPAGRAPRIVTTTCRYSQCKKTFTYERRGGTKSFCGPVCCRAASRASEAVNERDTDTRLGPPTPLLVTDADLARQRRRCMDMALDDAPRSAMTERFPGRLVNECIAEARRRGQRKPAPGWLGLDRLPVGLPA